MCYESRISEKQGVIRLHCIGQGGFNVLFFVARTRSPEK